MLNVLLWIWQLPQNVVGFIFSLFGKRYKLINKSEKINEIIVYIDKYPTLGAVSLGNYIIIFKGEMSYSTLKHELGHTYQSKYSGPLYLLVIGLISVIRNIYDRIAHKNMDNYFRYEWYYGGYPEKQANNLSAKYVSPKTLKDFMFKNKINFNI